MLQITIESNGMKHIRRFFVIDSHSHMGKDVDGAEMMNPMAPGTGTFDFWTKIESRLENEWEEGKSLKSFTAQIDGKPSKISLDFVQNPMITGLFQALEKRNKSGNYTEYYERIQHQKLVDFGVVFPFQDQFRDRKPEALYRASNTNIHRQTSKFPVSMRLIGYMRCDPMEGQKALNEIDHWATMPDTNIRGLKLHPRSEGWVDNIATPKATQALIKAAEHNLPVIFDTRGKQSIIDIGNLIRSTRTAIQNKNPHLLKNFKVIIAHAGQGNVGDEEVYRTLTQPNTWMDLSMLHGKGAEQFLTSFQQWCNVHQIQQTAGRKWSEFCLFATDYPYFGDQHAKELIEYLFNQSFFENGGTLEDSQNILGLNQIKLLPEYGEVLQTYSHESSASTFLQNPKLLPVDFPNKPTEYQNATQMMYNSLAALIDDNVVEIHKILPQFKEHWRNWEDEFCVITSLKSSKGKGEIIPLIYSKLLGEELGLLSTLPKDVPWNKFGMKYFNPKARDMYHKMFQTNFPAANGEDAAKMLKQVYS